MSNDYVTMQEYARIHDLPFEAVKSRVRYNLIPHIKVGRTNMIDRNTPWVECPKSGRPPKDKAESSRKSKFKVNITRAYYISIEDGTGKEVASDFTFLSKADAEKIGARMKSEVEGKL